MGQVFASCGFLAALSLLFAWAVVVTERHERRSEPPASVTPPPTHVRRLPG